MNSNPTEIAREALRQLARQRLTPTPDNYRRVYNEISGATGPDSGIDSKSTELRRLVRELPEFVAQRATIGASIETALAHRSWESAADALHASLRALSVRPDTGTETDAGKVAQVKNWAQLIDELIKEWEIRRPGCTAARKRESLQRTLESRARDPETLRERLKTLIATWQRPAPRPTVVVEIAEQAELVGQQAAEMLSELRAALVHTLESIAPAHLNDAPALAESARHLAVRVRGARDMDNVLALRNELREFLHLAASHSGGQAELRTGLLRLLRLLIDNIHEFAFGDSWLQQQVGIVRQALDKPLSAELLIEAEKAIRDLMLKQSLLKQSLDEARETLKSLVRTLVDQLGSLSETTGDFCVRLDRYGERISTAQQVSELNDVLAELIDDTRAIRSTTERTRHELNVARNRVGLAELRIQQMERELEALTERAREDTLTGALNRHGLNEAFELQAGRSDRIETPMCIALLDVDNFKQLNDRLGHQAGDAALLHLVEVIKSCLRGPDVVARYGGEEFVLLLPESDSAEAVEIMTRLQRELTKRFFLHNRERLLITFSCGVAQRAPAEPMETVLSRADRALYKAKQAGKNRVFIAEAA